MMMALMLVAAASAAQASGGASWDLGKDPAVCAATSSVSGSPTANALSIALSPVDDSARIDLVGARLFSVPRATVILIKVGGGAVEQHDGFIANTADGKASHSNATLSADDSRRMLAGENIVMALARETVIAVRTTGLAEASGRLIACRDTQRRALSLDPRIVAAVAVPASGNYDYILSGGSMPREALDREESGTTKLLLSLDTRGRVGDCRVVEHATPTLDKAACVIVKRRDTIKPARNAAGQPVASYALTTIKWNGRGARRGR